MKTVNKIFWFIDLFLVVFCLVQMAGLEATPEKYPIAYWGSLATIELNLVVLAYWYVKLFKSI
jgi:hypothetical protein